MKDTNQTFDIYFHDSENSNNKGFEESLNYCRDYIKMHAGTDYSYFADYKGGIASIVSNETGDTVEEYSVDDGTMI